MNLLKGWRGLWKKESVKRGLYNILALVVARKSDTMLNCGIVLSEPNEFPSNLAPGGDLSLGYRLYWQICQGIMEEGDSVLEIGCGAGDGISFLAKWISLKRVEGLDFARRLVALARRRHADTSIIFTTGNAYNLPYADNSFDVVLSVEASCCMADKRGFLSEARRVLKPGGRLVWADFFYRRESADHSIARCEDAIASTGWVIESKADHTEAVVASLNRVSDAREAYVENSVWRPFRAIARDFAVTKESSLYRSLNEGRARHLAYVLTPPR